MKKYILLLLLTFFSLHMEAQKKSKRDHIKSLKIAYITDHLDLTTEEAQKFWPIYNAYDEEMYRVKYAQYKKIKHQLKDEGFENLTENEAKEVLKKLQQIEKDEYELNKRFVENLDNVISAKKIIYLKKLEDDFNRELLDRLRKEYHNKKD
ncbi:MULTISPECIES: hypothetical protein [Galbibacter]|uniref:Sensor of ECF-type sigma factor n=1 Tax=Galbibacter pacificus TaxID=2996052 RepID=A0ABT6FNY6_9FLAO|nr:hypothetical protein [Galbibacter pacificus]MDG3581503.1 hypothetical protein [Galbibacter pacificus]MDG3584981.1 hypothetical protein [Galbibacter pacificus]